MRILNVVGSGTTNQKYELRGDVAGEDLISQLVEQDSGASYFNGVSYGKSSSDETSYGMPPLFVDEDTVFMIRGASSSGAEVITVYYTVVVDA